VGPLSAEEKFPEWPHPQVWPNALVGRSLVWRYEGNGFAHCWRLQEAGKGEAGYHFLVASGERIWSSLSTTLDRLNLEQLTLILAAAIGRRFGRGVVLQPGFEVRIELARSDLVRAGVAEP
jgi:hypothetical protein